MVPVPTCADLGQNTTAVLLAAIALGSALATLATQYLHFRFSQQVAIQVTQNTAELAAVKANGVSHATDATTPNAP